MTNNHSIVIINKKNPWMWAAISVALILLFALYKGCDNSKSQGAQLAKAHALIDSVVMKMAIDSARNTVVRDYYKALFEQQADTTAAIKTKRDSIGRALNKTNQSVASLIQERNMLRDMLPDSTFIKVSPKYVGQCDDCFDILEKTSLESKAYKAEAENLSDASAKQVLSYEEALQKEKTYSDSLFSMSRVLQGAYNKIIRLTEPKLQIYAGVSAGYWPNGIVYGGQLRMRTKSGGQQYGVKVLQIQKQVAYMGEVDFLLSFRKRK